MNASELERALESFAKTANRIADERNLFKQERDMLRRRIAEIREATLGEAYLAARGTEKLKDRSKLADLMYWKGRADAANAVRALKKKNSGEIA